LLVIDDRYRRLFTGFRWSIGGQGANRENGKTPFSNLEFRRPLPGSISAFDHHLGKTGIDPTKTVVRIPNASACVESMTMNLTALGAMRRPFRGRVP
jgi:hypothetical protein